jgi:ABC-type multidrug transport system permease subunit
MPLLEALGSALGQLAGRTVGYILLAAIYLLFVFLLWGFPWSRIIAKAGYKGKTYWTLLLMMVVPISIGPIVGPTSNFAEFCAGVAGISSYMVIWFLALFSWRQGKPKSEKV